VWKRLKQRKEDKETHMCGGQPSTISYLSLERKDDVVLLALQFCHSCLQHCVYAWREKIDRKWYFVLCNGKMVEDCLESSALFLLVCIIY
jgi:hypothetical protein